MLDDWRGVFVSTNLLRLHVNDDEWLFQNAQEMVVRLAALHHLKYQVIDQGDSSSRNTETRLLPSLT